MYVVLSVFLIIHFFVSLSLYLYIDIDIDNIEGYRDRDRIERKVDLWVYTCTHTCIYVCMHVCIHLCR